MPEGITDPLQTTPDGLNEATTEQNLQRLEDLTAAYNLLLQRYESQGNRLSDEDWQRLLTTANSIEQMTGEVQFVPEFDPSGPPMPGNPEIQTQRPGQVPMLAGLRSQGGAQQQLAGLLSPNLAAVLGNRRG